ncbi:glycoside hydrolase family 43 protein [Phellopilus nigrolimitatus]|nr:glycoside hydrolase family 43 protein [Phellopilus nigrolimitatus]
MHLSLSLGLLALASSCYAYPNPDTVTGNTTLHDPSVCKDNSGTYFLFTSGVGIQIRTSTDRVAWTYAGTAFPDGASWTDQYTNTSNGPLWAPDCTYVDGQFHIYYSASTTGSRNSAIFYAKSSTGQPGSFSNEGLVLSTTDADNYNAIDPNLFINGSLWYLSFGSYWSGIKDVTVDPSTGKTTSDTLIALAERTPDNGAMEASVVYQHGDYYYLFTSWGKAGNSTSNTSYNVRVGRSLSSAGGFIDASGVALLKGGGTLVLEAHDSVYGPGGQELLTDNDGPVLFYHYWPATGNKQVLGINRLDFSSGWPVVI